MVLELLVERFVADRLRVVDEIVAQVGEQFEPVGERLWDDLLPGDGAEHVVIAFGSLQTERGDEGGADGEAGLDGLL